MKYSLSLTIMMIWLLAGCAPVQPATAIQDVATHTPGSMPGLTATTAPFIASETPGPASTEPLQLQPDPLTPQMPVPTATEGSNSPAGQVRELDLIDRLASDPAAYRTDFAYLTSPLYLEELRARDARGETPGMSTTVIYLEPYDPAEFARAEKTMLLTHYDDSLRLQQEGFDTIFHLTQGILYVNLDSRPFVLEDVRLTEIGETSVLFYTMKWENRDGSVGYVSHVWMPRAGESLREEAAFATGLGDGFLLANGMFFAGKEQCVHTLRFWGGNPESVCDWYMDPVEEEKRREIYTHWQATGLLRNQLPDGSPYLPVSPGVLTEIKEERGLERPGN